MATLPIWTIKDVCEVMDGRINNKFDNLIVIDANGAIDKRRIGKSTLGVKLGIRCKTRLPFKMKRDLVFSRKEALRHMAMKKFGTIINDEMANSGYKRDFGQKEQIDLIKCLNMYADSYNNFIMIIGDFWDLDKDLRKLVVLRITCLQRGLAIIQIPKPTIFGNDPWNVSHNQKVENDWSESRIKKPQYSKLTTCVGILYFNDLTTQQRVEYEAVKKLKRGRVSGFEDAQVEDSEQAFVKRMFEKVKTGNVTPEMFRTVCELQGRNEKALRQRINEMLKVTAGNRTLKDFVVSDKTKRRRELLGLVKPSVT